eukprot:scaffold349513_cov28-Prasinocladus_malaysianus.AAC.1
MALLSFDADEASWHSAPRAAQVMIHLADSGWPELSLFGCLRALLDSQGSLKYFAAPQNKPMPRAACQVLVSCLVRRYAQAIREAPALQAKQ